MNLELLNRNLVSGGHKDRSNGLCALELVSWLADEPHSDHPQCTCSVLGSFTRKLNDYLPDAERQLLKPLLPKLIGTVTDRAGRGRRAFVAADWAVRIVLPLHLRRAKLEALALKAEAVAPIVDRETAKAARDVARKIRDAAATAAADAQAATYAAADAAATDAYAAAYAAATDAYAAYTYAAAYAAATDADAAYAYAAADAWKSKTSEGITLAESAVACLGRMIEP